MRMVDDFKKGNYSEYFEYTDICEIPIRENQLIEYKIHQILNLMVDYEYYYDFDVSITDMKNILQYAFNYLEELYKFKLN